MPGHITARTQGRRRLRPAHLISSNDSPAISGTPTMRVQGAYDAATRSYTLEVRQTTPATPGQAEKLPFHVPLAIGLLGPDGDDPLVAGITLFPNPGTGQLNVVVENPLRSPVTIRLFSILGIEVTNPVYAQKSGDRLISTLDTSTLRPGIYLVTIKLGERSVVRKWVK